MGIINHGDLHHFYRVSSSPLHSSSARERRGCGCREEPAHRGIKVRSPAVRACRAGEQYQGTRPGGTAASNKPTGEPCCSQLPPKIQAGQHKKSQSPSTSVSAARRPARAVVLPALAQSWNKCSPSHPVTARSVSGISLPADHAIPPLWGLSACEDLSVLFQDRNRHSLSQKSI